VCSRDGRVIAVPDGCKTSWPGQVCPVSVLGACDFAGVFKTPKPHVTVERVGARRRAISMVRHFWSLNSGSRCPKWAVETSLDKSPVAKAPRREEVSLRF
jgi:hypothetical protein